MPDAVRLALGTLTCVPVRAPERVDRRVAAAAILLAPAVGVVPGGAAAALMWAAGRVGLAPQLTAALAVGVLALVTRGLHLDGLADTADGLAASYDRSRALGAMRSGDTGPAGVAAVVLVLLVQVMALAEAGALAVLVAAVAGRAGLVPACVRGVPAARAGGLGATVAGAVPRLPAALLCLLVAVAAAVLWEPWWRGALAVLAAVAVTGALVARAVRRFGGITGDVLGAGVELSTAAALLCLAAGGR